MEMIVHRSESRGLAEHGWLTSRHSFSFASYHHPERMGFGLLRVLNDDLVAGGKGFATHSHKNMEIISIPLFGNLAHKDSTGREKVIRAGDVQIMSAGTGIAHSEYNHSADEEVQFLQIWIYPKAKDIAPHYDQKTFASEGRINQWQKVVYNSDDAAIGINQDAALSLADIDAGENITYEWEQEGNGLYLFVLNGEVQVGGQSLDRRDAVGITGVSSLGIKAKSYAELLAIEVPMR